MRDFVSELCQSNVAMWIVWVGRKDGQSHERAVSDHSEL